MGIHLYPLGISVSPFFNEDILMLHHSKVTIIDTVFDCINRLSLTVNLDAIKQQALTIAKESSSKTSNFLFEVDQNHSLLFKNLVDDLGHLHVKLEYPLIANVVREGF